MLLTLTIYCPTDIFLFLLCRLERDDWGILKIARRTKTEPAKDISLSGYPYQYL